MSKINSAVVVRLKWMSDFYGLGSTVGFIEIVEPETTSND